MLSVDDARARLLEGFTATEVIEVPVADAAGYALATDLRAPDALPRFDNSAMDGYAVRSAEVAEASEVAPVPLRLAGEIRAGSAPEPAVEPGTAVRIMTGAPIPPGADGVVPIEVAREEEGVVHVLAPPPPGGHVRPAGEDVRPGDVVARAGTELGPGEVALLAALGLSPVPVHRTPKVAVLVTGDELVAPESDPSPGQIRDSNSVALRALVEEAGARAVPLGPVADERDAVRDALARAASVADLVLSSGGVSVGRYDFVKDAVRELGAIDFWRVAMQPGKPVVSGSVKGTPFLGLPGNPVSIHVGFEQFVRPAIRKMRGCRARLRPTVRARLAQPIEKRPGRLHFVRVRLSFDGNDLVATPTGPQGSHIQSSLVDCHGVARFGVEDTRLEAGDRVVVEVWRLPGE